MGPARAIDPRRLAFALCLVGCRTAAPGGEAASATAPVALSEDAAVGHLPGYRSEMVAAPVFGGQVFVLEVGDPTAPPLVLVHGLGENGCRDFYPVLPALAARYHVLTFDLPGFGRSTHANELYSPARYAEFLHALVGARVHGRFNLAGHSMGGSLSLYYAAQYPADVARLLLIDAAAVLHRKAFVNFAIGAGLDNLLGGLAKQAKDLVTVAGEVADTALAPVLPGSPDPSLVLQDPALRASVLGSPMRIAALAVILENFGPVIDEVRAPAWILWGSNDAVASPRTGQVFARRLPSARLTVLEGSGHDPMATRPAAVEQFLLGALATPAPAPAARATTSFPALPERTGRCQDQAGLRFEGDYADITIDNCRDVVVKDVNAGALHIRNSYVQVETTRIETQAKALEISGSRVMITASDFSGATALTVAGSDLDLAGVVLRGRGAAVQVGGASKLIISVSRVESRKGSRYLHGVYEFDIGAEL